LRLSSVARAFEGDAFGKELEKRLVFPVAKDIAKLQAGVRKALAEPRGGDIVISGRGAQFRRTDAQLDGERLLLALHCRR
jgi:hypothetical protein